MYSFFAFAGTAKVEAATKGLRRRVNGGSKQLSCTSAVFCSPGTLFLALRISTASAVSLMGLGMMLISGVWPLSCPARATGKTERQSTNRRVRIEGRWFAKDSKPELRRYI